MHQRDKELQQLKAYAKGLGLSISFRPSKSDSPGAEYITETKEITVYTHSHQSKTDLLLLLLHELGHHLDFIYKGKRDAKALTDALFKEDCRKKNDPPIARSLRKYIYDCEYAGTAYMTVIAKETDLKIPMWKIEAEAQLDRWVARRYLQTGDYPSRKEVLSKRKELRSKSKEGSNGR